jgi:hypothetical protein
VVRAEKPDERQWCGQDRESDDRCAHAFFHALPFSPHILLLSGGSIRDQRCTNRAERLDGIIWFLRLCKLTTVRFGVFLACAVSRGDLPLCVQERMKATDAVLTPLIDMLMQHTSGDGVSRLAALNSLLAGMHGVVDSMISCFIFSLLVCSFEWCACVCVFVCLFVCLSFLVAAVFMLLCCLLRSCFLLFAIR